MQMPRPSGGPLTEWLYHIKPQLPFIIMTGDAGKDELRTLPYEPKAKLIMKPFGHQQFKALFSNTTKVSRES